MTKVQEAEGSESHKATTKLNKGAAKRFIQSALWEAKTPPAAAADDQAESK